MAVPNGLNPTFNGQVTATGVKVSDGGTITQATSATTGVTLNKRAGQITTVVQNIAAGAEVTLEVTNSEVAAVDGIIVNVASGNVVATVAAVTAVGAGSFKITLSNLDAATAETGTLVINFIVIKGSST